MALVHCTCNLAEKQKPRTSRGVSVVLQAAPLPTLPEQTLDGYGYRESSPDQPGIDDGTGYQRPWSRAANLLDACFDAQCGHRHGQREGIERVQRVRSGARQNVQ